MTTVEFDCGGTLFKVSRNTVNKYPDSMLAAMINSSMKGSNFIDRDPEIFKLIIEYYRTDKVIIPDNIPSEKVMDELDYFCLSGVRPQNMDLNVWWMNSNNHVKNTQSILDTFVKSQYFQEEMTKKVEIKWIIHDNNVEFLNYNSFFIVGGDFIVNYLKNTYNIKCIVYEGRYNAKTSAKYLYIDVKDNKIYTGRDYFTGKYFNIIFYLNFRKT